MSIISISMHYTIIEIWVFYFGILLSYNKKFQKSKLRNVKLLNQ